MRILVWTSLGVALAWPSVALVAQAAPAARLEAVVAELEEALGGAAALAGSGDAEFRGTLHLGDARFSWRLALRQRPFGFREDLDYVDGLLPGMTDPSEIPDDLRQGRFVSDGERVWALDGPGPRGAYLRGPPAVAALDAVNTIRLLREPRAVLAQAKLDPAVWPLPRAPGGAATEDTGAPVHRLGVRFSHGSSWVLFVDATSGLPLGFDDILEPPRRGFRFEGWRQRGSLSRPSLRWETAPGILPCRLEIDHFDFQVQLDPAEFGGEPRPKLPALGFLGPLRVLANPVPGAGALLLSDLRVERHGPIAGVFDTGASGFFADLGLVQHLTLPLIGMELTRSIIGAEQTPVHFVDRLDLGPPPLAMLAQVPLTGTRLPPFDELPADVRLGLVLGGRRLMDLAPVLDFEVGGLYARSLPAQPLRRLPGGGPVLELPADFDAWQHPHVEFGVLDEHGARLGTRRALLDTGFPHLLRISPAALAAFGLPADAATWRARGAVAWGYSGAGGVHGKDLLVRLPEVALGPLRYQQPWVMLAGLGNDPPDPVPFDCLVGAAALLPFAQVGFDRDRQVIELRLRAGGDLLAGGPESGAEDTSVAGERPTPGVTQGITPARFVIPPPGPVLGLILKAFEAAQHGEDVPAGLPCLVQVLPGTAADAAGLLATDHLARVGDFDCRDKSPADLFGDGPLGRVQAGEDVTLQVVRDGGTIELVLRP